MDRIDNWQQVAQRSRQQKIPVVVMVDQEDCPYCERVEREYFSALLANGEWNDKVIFGKISLDSYETIINPAGESVPTRQFLAKFKASLTPTILFLDSDGTQLTDKMIGLSTPDYYLYYLEKAIETSWNKLNL